MRNKLGLRLAVIGLLVSLIVSVGLTVMPQKAYADGETYVFTTSFQNGTVVNIIQGTGGSYKGTAEFFCFQSCGTPGQTNTWRNAVFLLNPPNTAGPSGCGAAGSTVSIRFLNFGSDGKWPAQVTNNAGACKLTPNITVYDTNNIMGAGAASPPSATPPATTTQDACEESSGSLGWLACPVINAMASGATQLDCWILDQLTIDTQVIFNDGTGGRSSGCDPTTSLDNTPANDAKSSQAFHTAWGVFRNIAYALLLIIGLIMVISQIADLELFSAYTIRKMLPKLGIAAVFIPLSWPALSFVFNASNDSAYALMDLIQAPFKGINANIGTDGGDITIGAILAVALVGAVIAGAAYLFVLGPMGILALVGTVLLAVLSAFVLLAARNVVAYILIIAAPLAIICSAFEPFKKLFTLWKTLILAILLSVPIVSAVIQMSHEGALIAYIANNTLATLTSIAILIGGYALIWTVFKKLDNVAGNLGDIVSSTTGRLGKGLAGYRGNAAKQRYGEAIESRRKIALGGLGAVGLGRRARAARQPGVGAAAFTSLLPGTRTAKAKYGEAVRTMQAKTMEQMLKEDEGRGGGDDDAMKILAKEGMTEKRFLDEYAGLQMDGLRKQGMGEGQARQVALSRARAALGLSQASLGAQVGTAPMQVAAAKSLLKSNTSYRRNAAGQEMGFDEMTQTMYEDVGKLVRQGLITVADGAGMIKQNGARADRAGVGYGTAITNLDLVARQGPDVLRTVNPDTGKTYVEGMANEVLEGTGPGQLIAQRHEAVRILAPEMVRRAREAYAADGNQPGPKFIQQIAAAAGRRDMAGQIAELNAGLNAAGFESQTVNKISIQQWEEYFRTQAPPEMQAIFQRYRREYSNAAQAQAQAQAGQQPGQGPPGVPGV